MSDEKELCFHPDAVDSFRDRGQHLLEGIVPIPKPEPRQHFEADRHPVAVFTENNILRLGPLQTVNTLTMEVSEIAFLTPTGLSALQKEQCIEVEKLSEAIQRTSDFRIRISHEFVRSTLLDWLQVRLNGETDQDLPAFTLEKARASIHLVEVWVPLANLAVESPIKLGPVYVRPISRQTMDIWFEQFRVHVAPENVGESEAALERLRVAIQGLAAAQIAVRSERQVAINKAVEKAEEVASFFRLFHPANSQPGAAFYCRTLGRENIESYSAFVVQNGEYEGRTEQTIPPSPDIWELDNVRLAQLEQDLDPVRKLLASGKRTEFQRVVCEAIFLYTRSTMAREPSDKLVFIFSALESTLLKNETEPIQTHIADRLAFVLGVTVEERRKIVRLVRTCYGFRSSFLHHGRTLSDAEILGQFMMYAWVFFMRLTKLAHRYDTRNDFLEAIETRKYSVP